MATTKITFTAILPDGQEVTRTSGTMPYVAVSYGSQLQWHKSFAAAHKAAVSNVQTYATGKPAEVIPCYPTKIVGKLNDWTPEVDGWGDIPASAFAELVAAKKAGKVADQAELPVAEDEPEHAPVEAIEAAIVAGEAHAAAQAEAQAEAPAPAPARKATAKQLLGEQVHQIVLAALDAEGIGSIRLPEGMSYDAAADTIGKWLQYIPTPATPGGWQPKKEA